MMRLQLVTADRSVLAIVTGAESSAKREGYGFCFVICSERCGVALRAAPAEETSWGHTVAS
jgi:hypothetical protein